MFNKLNYIKLEKHPVYKNFEIITIGIWQNLDETTKQIIFQISSVLVEKSLGQSKYSKNFKKDIIKMLSNGILFIIRDSKSNQIATLAKYKIRTTNNNNILILQLAITESKYNIKPLYTTYLKKLIINNKINYICLRSQNPKTYTIIKKYSFRVFPSINNNNIPQYIKNIVKIILCDIGNNNFNINTFVDKGSFQENVYQNGINYRSKNDNINKLFDKRLNYNQGDSLLIIGEINEIK